MKPRQANVMVFFPALLITLALFLWAGDAIPAEDIQPSSIEAPNEPNKTTDTNKPAESPRIAELRAGKNFIRTKVYGAEEDEQILKLFEGLRVSDVVDGMDKVGLKNIGLMSPEIKPLWRDTEHFTHRIVGIAVTARYVPTNKSHTPEMDTKAFNAWYDKWYGTISAERFVPLIRKGTIVVIEEPEGVDTGTIGSNNIMRWKTKGCVGVVTNSGARDTDEIIAEKIPLYFRKVGRGVPPGRNEMESVNRPIVCGGVLVMPGDVIVADGDGVVVVPREKAKDVAEYARATLEKDKKSRRTLYKQLGLPEDDSVK
jgi:4-hydroxy-4-methyl-2-oxoglutarate aldolase